ncbi:hypothetical protein EYR36_004128 [Pleurotus pulmonarius]|nr:hypothetical protein EYR36_004128 [Pleurotus pulmonarius]
MAKNPLLDDDDVEWEKRFVSALYLALDGAGSSRRWHAIRPPVCELIEWKRTQTCVPTPHQVHAQIALLGQYAILSHCWDRDQELSFADINNLSDPAVQAKKGFTKLSGFSKVVESLYGYRYVWMDSACIDEADRNESIPRMFGWYRHAYVCVIYLSTSASVSKDPGSTRGWTLQEFLAASRIKCFTGNSDSLDNNQSNL